MYMSFKKYEANDYGHKLDLLIILHQFYVSYVMRSGRREKSIRITHAYVAYVGTPTLVERTTSNFRSLLDG